MSGQVPAEAGAVAQPAQQRLCQHVCQLGLHADWHDGLGRLQYQDVSLGSSGGCECGSA